jgi:hypothetical protein
MLWQEMARHLLQGHILPCHKLSSFRHASTTPQPRFSAVARKHNTVVGINPELAGGSELAQPARSQRPRRGIPGRIPAIGRYYIIRFPNAASSSVLTTRFRSAS